MADYPIIVWYERRSQGKSLTPMGLECLLEKLLLLKLSTFGCDVTIFFLFSM